MKLTTATCKNKKSTTNAFLLKKLMQKAAECPVHHKSSYRMKENQTAEIDPYSAEQHPLENKQNCINFIPNEESKAKGKGLSMVQSFKTIETEKDRKFVNKSGSLSNLQILKLKSLSRSAPRFGKNTVKGERLDIDNFRLGRKLGRGRFGNVFMAQEKQTQFLIAIKIVNKKQLREAGMEQQLISEIKIQSYMKHPNILSLYSFFDDATNIYLLLELADQCLFKVLRRKVCFPEAQTACFIKQVVEGLRYMHSENVIHRDLKPENLMIVNDVVKLADFGWSTYSPLYKRQTFCGTLDYVSPEIIKGDFYDETVDIWSLGILLYELSVGSAPFEGTFSEEETFQKIVTAKFQIPTFLSAALQKVIRRVLRVEPRERGGLRDIQESEWAMSFSKQGRGIGREIWEFWEWIR